MVNCTLWSCLLLCDGIRYSDESPPFRLVMASNFPSASSAAVRKSMQGNKSKNTIPELKVRRKLRMAGFPGYRLHWRINDSGGRYLCRPDISYPGRKLAIFVHGCFWHRCPTCNLPEPVNNGGYWREKFDRNLKRDIEKDDLLNQLGWKTFVIWECQIDALDPLKIATESGLIC